MRRSGEGLTLGGLREAAGLPAKNVAIQMEVSRKALWAWENGYRRMPAGAALRLAGILGVPVERVIRAHESARADG